MHRFGENRVRVQRPPIFFNGSFLFPFGNQVQRGVIVVFGLAARFSVGHRKRILRQKMGF
jgi:hypothetical protein